MTAVRRILAAWALALATLLALVLATPPAAAHKPSDSYLTLAVDERGASGRWDIALRDLDLAIGLDADGDGAITWGELRERHAEIAAYATARLAVSADGTACAVEVGAQQVDDHTDGAYTVLPLRLACPPAPSRIGVAYTLFADLDPQHRGLLQLTAGGTTRSAILGPDSPEQAFVVGEGGGWSQFGDYLRDGVWHIWIGFDHILFLLSLLLPAVVFRTLQRWEPVDGFAPALRDVVGVVTSFTVAHSITLTLATLQVVSLPSRWVESIIAASVVIAALNNVRPLFAGRRWIVAFAFGLIHGFGFASVLVELGLPTGTLALALLGFNLGVELGQLAIVVVFLPLAFALRRTWFYRRAVLVGGSLAIAALAAVWLAERALDVELLAL